MAVTPAGDRLYATIQELPGGARRVMEFDAADGTLLQTLTVDEFSQGLALTPTGDRLYVGSESGTLYSCDLGGPITCDQTHWPQPVWGVAMSPDGRFLYTTTGEGSWVGLGVVTFATATLQPLNWIGIDGPATRVVSSALGTLVISEVDVVLLPPQP